MINRMDRKQDFEKLIGGLDISLTMYNNAVEKYTNLAKYLQENGIDCEIYPQGSFATGTVVRPYKKGKELEYDLDFICKVFIEKTNTTPKEARDKIIEVLNKSELYRTRLKEYDKCITLKYADLNDIGFNMDLVNGVIEDEKINILHGVAITNKLSDKSYRWSTINPKAYSDWFNKINEPFISYMRENRTKTLMESYKDIFNSVEDIPDHFIKTPLQRIIQILKRHRDMFLHRKRTEKEIKSSIIVTLCTKISENANRSNDILELLDYILKEFNNYSKLVKIKESSLDNTFQYRKAIQKVNGKWKIENPVNPEDNLADYWNDDFEIANLFFEWIEAVKEEFIDSFEKNDEDFIYLLESAVGTSYLEKMIKKEKYSFNVTTELVEPKKSWRAE